MYIVTLHQQFRSLKLYLSLDVYQLQRHVISKTYSNKIATTFKLLVMLFIIKLYARNDVFKMFRPRLECVSSLVYVSYKSPFTIMIQIDSVW